MTRLHITTDKLRDMIGLNVLHEGVACCVVEIIDDGPSLVLECIDHRLSIQPDQFGEAHRRVPQTFTVSVLSIERTEFSSSFLSLEPLD
jgi:hypothetical protein